MNVRDGKENIDSKAQVCPFLGLRDDPATALSFPSSQNHCFHAKPVNPVKLEFQRTKCLSINHTNCKEYNREPNTHLPPEIRYVGGNGLREKFGKSSAWILLFVLVIIVLIAWQLFSGSLLGFGNPGQSPGVTVPAFSSNVGSQATPILTGQQQDTPTPSLFITATPTFPIQTFASTVVLPHALETPIGVEHKLVIHRVLAGESLVSIASQYWTTVEAIQAVNYSLPSPLRIDWLIIVPISQTEINGSPVFEAYQVKTDVAVRILAQQLSVDPALLELYNGLGNDEFLSSGEWVLVPHRGTATP